MNELLVKAKVMACLKARFSELYNADRMVYMEKHGPIYCACLGCEHPKNCACACIECQIDGTVMRAKWLREKRA